MKPASPVVADVLLRLVIDGRGLLIVKVIALEVPPDGVGLKTVTPEVPVVARSEVRMVAVNLMPLT